jgi:hypothetical protein
VLFDRTQTRNERCRVSKVLAAWHRSWWEVTLLTLQVPEARHSQSASIWKQNPRDPPQWWQSSLAG